MFIEYRKTSEFGIGTVDSRYRSDSTYR